ncbi:MAG: hypothetical protein JSS87_10285 [Acidobacteria bacterium]|nr:hypothetical protein [Acidobacteriota bacterium]
MSLTTRQAEQVRAAAQQAGLEVLFAEASTGFNDAPTARYTIALAGDTPKTETLELSESFDPTRHADALAGYLKESARRLRNPLPDAYVTLGGLPILFRNWKWPFHRSTSGADTYIVHGDAVLHDGSNSDTPLHAKVSASMTVTFADVVPAPEQPFCEGFIYNAVRKIMDQGQLELVKSGNRQPVPVTTRYYSPKQNKFIFNDTNEQQRQDFLAAKIYWLSGRLGNNAPVWILDPRDAQYLDTTVDVLKKTAEALAGEGIIRLEIDTEYATATEALMGHASQYEAEMADALAFTKPSFNEDMRAGHTNM